MPLLIFFSDEPFDLDGRAGSVRRAGIAAGVSVGASMSRRPRFPASGGDAHAKTAGAGRGMDARRSKTTGVREVEVMTATTSVGEVVRSRKFFLRND